MFPGGYFPKRFYAPRYWSGAGGILGAITTMYLFLRRKSRR